MASVSFFREMANEEEDRSIDFSVDPEMHTKLGVAKARKGEEKSFDTEKIYDFQMKKDIAKVVKMRGSFEHRNKTYLSLRERDPQYNEIAKPKRFAEDGKFTELEEFTKSYDWKTTAKPYGTRAHKKYLEYVHSVLKGPNDAVARDRLQRELDQALHHQIVSGKAELTRKQILEKEELELLRSYTDPRLLTDLEDKLARHEALKNNQFEKVRNIPTSTEFKESVQEWDKGIDRKYDQNDLFPIPKINWDGYKDVLIPVKDAARPYIPPTVSSDLFIKDAEQEEQRYVIHKSNIIFELIKERREEHEKEKKKEEKMKAKAMKLKEQGTNELALKELTSEVNETSELNPKQNINVVPKSDMGTNNLCQDQNALPAKNLPLKLRFNIPSLALFSEPLLHSPQKSTQKESSVPPPMMELNNNEEPKFALDMDNEEGNIADMEAMQFDEQKAILPSDNLLSKLLPLPASIWSSSQSNLRSKRYAAITPSLDSSPSRISPSKRDTMKAVLLKSTNTVHTMWEAVKKPFIFQFDEDGVYQSTTQVKKQDTVGHIETMIDTIHQPEFQGELMNFKAENNDNLLPITEQGDDSIPKPNSDNDLLDAPIAPVKKKKQKKSSTEEGIDENGSDDNIEDQKMSFREYHSHMNKKRKYLQKKILKLQTNSDPNKDTLRKIALYKTRLKYLDDQSADIKLKEQESAAIIAEIQQHLEGRIGDLENLPDTFFERMKRETIERIPFLQPATRRAKLNSDEALQKQLLALLPTPLVPLIYDANYIAPKVYSDIPEFTKSQLQYEERVLKILRNYFIEVMFHRSILGILVGNRDKVDIVVPSAFLGAEDLITACGVGDFKRVISLLDNRDDLEVYYDPALHSTVPVNQTTTDGMTALYYLLYLIVQQDFTSGNKSRQAELVQNLFATDWQIFYRKYFVSNTQKLAAARAFLKNLQLNKTIPLLLYYGADINYSRVSNDSDGYSILHCTVQTNQLGLLKWLIVHGANVNQLTSILHATPLMLAVQANQMEIVMFLLNPENSRSIAMISHADEEGNTVLHYAAKSCCDMLMIELLLMCGVTQNKRNKAGFLANEVARKSNKNDVAKFMMTYRYNMDDLKTRINFMQSQNELTGTLKGKLLAGEIFENVVPTDSNAIQAAEDDNESEKSFNGKSWKSKKRSKKEDPRITSSMKKKDQLWKAAAEDGGDVGSTKFAFLSFLSGKIFH